MIVSAEEFVELRTSDRPDKYVRAAREDAEREVLWLDIIQRFPDMRFWVAQNKTVPVEVVALLARDPDPRVRLMVAMKKKLTDELFGLLAVDRDDSVRAAVANNKKVPSGILRTLADDLSTIVSLVAQEKLRQL